MFRIENFIDKYFPEATPYGGSGTEMSVNCPFCGDTKGHLTISLSKEVCHCFRCDYKAPWIKLVMDITGFTYYKAIHELYYKPKLSEEKSMISRFHYISTKLEHRGSVANLPSDFRLLKDTDSEASRNIKNYLVKRGFDNYYWNKYNLGMSEEYPLRVIIPIEDGYWQGRAISNWLQPKYINPKADSRSVIFNSEALEIYDEVVVCEGAFSAMAIGSNAIALIGKNVTQEKQDRIIKSNIDHLIIALESGAFDSMQVLMETAYSCDKKVTVWKYNVGDPADSTDFDILEYDLKTRVTLKLK